MLKMFRKLRRKYKKFKRLGNNCWNRITIQMREKYLKGKLAAYLKAPFYIKIRYSKTIITF